MTRTTTILVADDDPDDRMMIKDACEEARLSSELVFVEDGEELMQYLRGEGAYADRAGKSFHGIILLDLNMPKKDGREALREIKDDPRLRRIPVVVLTKPVTFEGLVDVVKALNSYWLQIVTFPSNGDNAG